MEENEKTAAPMGFFEKILAFVIILVILIFSMIHYESPTGPPRQKGSGPELSKDQQPPPHDTETP